MKSEVPLNAGAGHRWCHLGWRWFRWIARRWDWPAVVNRPSCDVGRVRLMPEILISSHTPGRAYHRPSSPPVRLWATLARFYSSQTMLPQRINQKPTIKSCNYWTLYIEWTARAKNHQSTECHVNDV